MSIHQPIGELLDEQTIITINRPEAGDIILEYLKELEVEYVFGVPGGAIEPLFNALARSETTNGPKAVIARHEAGSVFMADGYARESGKIGVCLATTGPGATNMLTGVASAYQDETPILVITGQTPLNKFGSGAVQESSCTAIDTVALFKHCTVYSTLISHPDQLEKKLISAICLAYQHRRPVHISIPLDIARNQYDPLPQQPLLPPFLGCDNSINLETTKALAELLNRSRHPVFVIGEGCAKAIPKITEYCEFHGGSIVATPQGKGLINPYHPNFYGVCGLAGHMSATNLLNSPEVDLVVIVGSLLDQQAIYGWDPNCTSLHKIVHIDSNQSHFLRSQCASLNIYGNIESIFDYLINFLEPKTRIHSKNKKRVIINEKPMPFERRRAERRKNHENVINDSRKHERRNIATLTKPLIRNFRFHDELKYLSNDSPIKPQRIMYELSRKTDSHTRFLADIGNSFLWAIHYLSPHHNPSSNSSAYLYMGMGFASMAWSVSASVGIALAKPDKPVICIVGDGSMLMSAHEITVAVQLGLPIIYVILNDQAYGTVKHGQKMAGAASIGAELPPVDFSVYAKAIGAEGILVKTLDDFLSIDFHALHGKNIPTILDIHIDSTEAPPLAGRLEMLASGHT